MAALRAELSGRVRAERLASQLLSGPPASSVETVTERLLAVQAQDPRGVRLAVRARSQGLTVSDFDAGLADRSLLVSWLCRGTLHLVRTEDYFWLHDLTTPPLRTSCLRRLVQEGVSPGQAARATGLITRWLAEHGPLTRDELAERLGSRRIPVAGQAMVHILFYATLEGLIVRGPIKGRRQAFVLAQDWLGPRPARRDPVQARAELARRYLVGHAPASEQDIARWAGLPLRDIRVGLDRIAAQLRDRGHGLLALTATPELSRTSPARLLGAFDPLMVGWKDRRFLTGGRDGDVIRGGVFRPFILAGGRAAGLWRVSGLDVQTEPFEPLARADLAALERDADDVRRYLLLRVDPQQQPAPT